MKKNWIIFFIAIITTFIGIYVHTNTLSITHHKLNLGPNNKKLRLAHISDLHSKGLNNLEKQLITALENEKVDLIVITGDLATPSGSAEGYDRILEKFKAPLGVYFVRGNWEYWEPINKLGKKLEKYNIIDLNNKSQLIGVNLFLIGFDDSEEGTPNLDIVNEIPKSGIKIGLFHSPIFFDKVAGKINLSLAGHSHGGQIRFPFLKPIWLPEGTGQYDQGWFGKNGSKLFVSKGIGTSMLPIRLNCSPELAILDITY